MLTKFKQKFNINVRKDQIQGNKAKQRKIPNTVIDKKNQKDKINLYK